MSRAAKVWWNKQKQAWCSEVGGRRQTLARGRKNKAEAQRRLKSLLDKQALLREVHGAMTVARLCEDFLADAAEHLERRTYESYRYGCQKFVDLFGARLAHTIEPLDIERFSVDLKRTLNETSRAIVLRAVQRCFNWGVETRRIVSTGNCPDSVGGSWKQFSKYSDNCSSVTRYARRPNRWHLRRPSRISR
jgi:hypothetical protein